MSAAQIRFMRTSTVTPPLTRSPFATQTFSTSDNDATRFDPESVKPDGKTCRFNPWPYPIA